MAKKRLDLIVFAAVAYGESSYVLRCISREQGIISVLAKGYRTKDKATPLVIPAEYEALLYEPQEQGLWLLNELTLARNLAAYPHASSWAAALCGVELVAGLIAPASDQAQIYDLLLSYVDYLGKISANGILIFWRFFIRVCTVVGIGNPLANCCTCHTPLLSSSHYCIRDSGFICPDCRAGWQNMDELTSLSPQATLILKLLPEIGNHLQEFAISRSVITEINHVLLLYWVGHTKQTLKLKSLGVLVQFYPV